MNQIVQYDDGSSISFAEYGDPEGYPILIQHGLIASIRDYNLFGRLIESGARLICMARPGYGESSLYVMKHIGEWGEIVSAVIDELKLDHFDVLGISSGAPYSYAIGHKFPDRVGKIFILSGTPALYDDAILGLWPYPVDRHASIAGLEKLAHELFFSNLADDGPVANDIRDSMMNDCFGIAQDLKLRCLDWGFRLQDVPEAVYMRHSKTDASVPFITAEMTSKLLPNCKFEARENDEHFSNEVLDDFIRTIIELETSCKINPVQ